MNWSINETSNQLIEIFFIVINDDMFLKHKNKRITNKKLIILPQNTI